MKIIIVNGLFLVVHKKKRLLDVSEEPHKETK